MDGNRVTDLGPVIVEPYHLSFPFLFTHEGTLYMCPECSGSGQIRVYRCTGFPLQWELAAVLMENVSAADTMLFPRDGRWWIAETGYKTLLETVEPLSEQLQITSKPIN